MAFKHDISRARRLAQLSTVVGMIVTMSSFVYRSSDADVQSV
jgi:hypothetical protein